ncbi:MAG: aminopeptidase P family protein [Oscillospiraceae bacterium]
MRVKKLSEQLKSDETALITSTENRKYFTDFSSTDGYLLVSATGSIFITDSRYIEAARSEIKECDEILLQNKVSYQIDEALEKFGAKKLLIEASRTTVSQYNEYKEKYSNFNVVADGELDKIIDAMRAVKDEEEKAKIIKAQRIAEKAFEFIAKYIEEGKTERQIALELDYFMLKNGAEDLAFDTIVVSGKNSSKPHGVPSKKRIEKGDFITMDFGCCIGSYHSDMTRTVAVGDVTTRMAQVYDTVLKAQQEAISKIRNGASASECDKAARDVIDNAGFDGCFGHGTGHSLGIEIHEKPALCPSSRDILKTGNIVTVEPGIYLEGSMGVRIEDMLFVTENGSENLTNAPKALLVL